MKKYQEFCNNQIFESGLRDVKKIIKNYPSKEAEAYFHQDLDGVTSALAMKTYLENYGVKTVDAHIIQYGGMEFAIEKTKPGRLPYLIDFAHGKPMFVIQTDHHQGQAGTEDTESTHFKAAPSNVETISGEISPSDIFTAVDIKLINTIDSADFLRRGLKPEDISNSIFDIDQNLSGEDNRFMMGLVTNRLLLAYKNKKITGTSLDGREYKDKNFLECLVLDSNASLVSMYNNIKHYINNFTTKNWLKSERKYDLNGKLATPETLQKNVLDYQEKMKDYHDLKIDDEYNIGLQYGGGKMFKPGSYDRYTVFKNNPSLNFYSIAWPMGLLQVAANPFKEKELDVDLGAISNDLLETYKPVFSKVWIDILSVKKVSEMDIIKMKEKGKDVSDKIGFKATDLEAFYNDKMYHLVNGKIVQYNLTDDIKKMMNKPVDSLNYNEKKELRKYKISWFDLIKENSGGHKSITNISSFNYFPYAHPKLKKYVANYFNIQKKPKKWGKNKGKMSYEYGDIMRKVQNDFIETLRERIDLQKDNKKEKIIKSYESFVNESLSTIAGGIILGALGLSMIYKIIKKSIENMTLNSKLSKNKLKKIVNDIYYETRKLVEDKGSDTKKIDKWKINMEKRIEEGEVKNTKDILDKISDDELFESTDIQEKDFFNNLEDLPSKIKDIVDNYSEQDNTYENQKGLLDELEKNGWTCNFGLDGISFNLKPMN